MSNSTNMETSNDTSTSCTSAHSQTSFTTPPSTPPSFTARRREFLQIAQARDWLIAPRARAVAQAALTAWRSGTLPNLASPPPALPLSPVDACATLADTLDRSLRLDASLAYMDLCVGHDDNAYDDDDRDDRDDYVDEGAADVSDNASARSSLARSPAMHIMSGTPSTLVQEVEVEVHPDASCDDSDHSDGDDDQGDSADSAHGDGVLSELHSSDTRSEPSSHTTGSIAVFSDSDGASGSPGNRSSCSVWTDIADISDDDTPPRRQPSTTQSPTRVDAPPRRHPTITQPPARADASPADALRYSRTPRTSEEQSVTSQNVNTPPRRIKRDGENAAQRVTAVDLDSPARGIQHDFENIELSVTSVNINTPPRRTHRDIENTPPAATPGTILTSEGNAANIPTPRTGRKPRARGVGTVADVTGVKKLGSLKGSSEWLGHAPFMQARNGAAEKLLQYFDAQVLGGEVVRDATGRRRVTVGWNARLYKTAGVTYLRRRGGSGERTAAIELSLKVLDEPCRLYNTLAHEICHAATWIVDEVAKPPHGAEFKSWAKRFAEWDRQLLITTCHAYAIRYKFTYKCVTCGQSYGRHSKSINTEKQVCGICKGRLALAV